MNNQPSDISSCAIESEQCVIGLVSINADSAIKLFKSILKPEDFFRPIHANLYKAGIDLFDSGIGIDNQTLLEEVRKYDNTTEWEGERYLATCVDKIPHLGLSQADYHAKRIKAHSAKRQAAQVAIELRQRLSKPDADPDEVLTWAKGKLGSIGVTSLTDLSKISDDIVPHLDWLGKKATTEGLEGFSTGFSHIDNVTGGYGQPLFVILKGRRKQGKTHHCMAPIYSCLKVGSAALFVSMDTPKRIIINRLLAYITGINSYKIQRLQTDDEWAQVLAAFTWLEQQPLFMSHKSGTTVSMIESKCESIIDQGFDLKLVVIDYAELMRSDEKAQQREQELSSIAVGLQNLRNKFGITIILLSQVNKDGGARWSEGLENAVDLILKWDIEEYHSGTGKGKLSIEGNRVGSAGDFDCAFDFGTSRIREYELDYSDPSCPPSWPWWYDEANDEQLPSAPSQNIQSASGWKPKEEED